MLKHLVAKIMKCSVNRLWSVKYNNMHFISVHGSRPTYTWKGLYCGSVKHNLINQAFFYTVFNDILFRRMASLQQLEFDNGPFYSEG